MPATPADQTDLLQLTARFEGEAAAGASLPELPPGTRVGRYRIQQLIGRGGMGAVFLAEQVEPMRRLVAIKLVRRAHLDRDNRARFDLERQALAQLAHPGIAQIHDAGSTPEGTAFFVMEYVEGQRLDAWWEPLRRDPLALLGGLRELCLAVGHAHRRGIVHCDLKPANVLATSVDGRPLLKVIDFGIARAVGTRDDGVQGGTPEYMAPEQARPGAIIDPRCDVYALGVLLHEALLGRPLRAGLRQGDPDNGAMLRAVASWPDAAVEPEHLAALPLSRGRRRELAAILNQALAADPARRQEDANALAEEIGRWLAQEPLLAMPASRGYQFGCWLRRHRYPALAGLAGLLLSGVFLVQSWHQYQQTRVERDTAEQVVGILLDTFQAADPVQFPGGSASARELLAGSAQRISARQLAPAVRLRVLRALAEVQLSLELYDDARSSVARALDGLPDLPGRARDELLLLREQIDQHAGEFALVEGRLRALLARKPALDSDLHLRMSLLLADNLYLQGRLVESQALFTEISPHASTSSDVEIRMYWHRMQGRVYGDRGDSLKSLTKLQEALRLAMTLWGGSDLRTLDVANDLALAHSQAGQIDEALTMLEQIARDTEAAWGSDSAGLAIVLDNLGVSLQRNGAADRAEALHRRAAEIFEQRLGPESMHTGTSFNNLATALDEQGRTADAFPWFERAERAVEAALGPRHLRMGFVLHNYARARMAAGEPERAAELLERSREILTAQLNEGHPRLHVLAVTEAELGLQKGDIAAALKALKESLPEVLEAFGDTSSVALRNRRALHRALSVAGHCAEAAQLAQDIARIHGQRVAAAEGCGVGAR